MLVKLKILIPLAALLCQFAATSGAHRIDGNRTAAIVERRQSTIRVGNSHRRRSALDEDEDIAKCPRVPDNSCTEHDRSPHVPSRLRCFWNDEFDGHAINQAHWTFQNLDVNGEQQHYTNQECKSPDNNDNDGDDDDSDWNYCVRDGTLTIRARNRGIHCPDDPACADDFAWPDLPGHKPHTSGRLITKNKVRARNGYLEVRARLPQWQLPATQSGLWPAVWLLGNNIDEGPASCRDDRPAAEWPHSGEFDLLEWKSPSNSLVWNAIWADRPDGSLTACSAWPANGHAACGPCRRSSCTGVTETEAAAAAADDSSSTTKYAWNGISDFQLRREFNVYGLHWTRKSMEVFVNGQKVSRLRLDEMSDSARAVFERPMFVILNLAVGGALGGPVADDLDWEQAAFDIDYVRWYR